MTDMQKVVGPNLFCKCLLSFSTLWVGKLPTLAKFILDSSAALSAAVDLIGKPCLETLFFCSRTYICARAKKYINSQKIVKKWHFLGGKLKINTLHHQLGGAIICPSFSLWIAFPSVQSAWSVTYLALSVKLQICATCKLCKSVYNQIFVNRWHCFWLALSWIYKFARIFISFSMSFTTWNAYNDTTKQNTSFSITK